MVDQPPRRCHNDLRVLFQRVDLRLHRLAAVYRHDGKARDVFAQLADLLGDLQAKLPRGAKDDPLHIPFLRIDALHHRYAEGAGFAGPGGGLGNDLPARQQFRDRLLLDLGHFGKAHLRNAFFDFLPDGQFLIVFRHFSVSFSFP